LSEFGKGIGDHANVWECPDLFPLEYNGETKWVLLVSLGHGPNGGCGTQYFIGDFDGTTYTADALPYPLWLEYGRDNYAGVTWNDTPDGRRILIGWMSSWDYGDDVPSVRFRGAMTLPRELSLAHNGRHPILVNYPVFETRGLIKESRKFDDIDFDGHHTIEPLCPGNRGAYIIDMMIRPGDADKFGFTLANDNGEQLGFAFDLQTERLEIDRSNSGVVDFNSWFITPIFAPLERKNSYRISLYIDSASSELFVNGGEVVLTNIVFPTAPYDSLEFSSDAAISIENIVIGRI
jgi:fructan beta-fructosidase